MSGAASEPSLRCICPLDNCVSPLVSCRQYWTRQKEGCPIHPHCYGPYNPCYDPYGPYGLKNGIQSVKGCLRSINYIIAREGIYCLSVRTTVFLKALTRTMDTYLNFCILKSGAPNDGFLLNTLRTPFKAIQSTFRSLEMHALWNYKICICSVILGELEIIRALVLLSRKF